MDNEFRVTRLMRMFERHGGKETDRVKLFGSWPENVRDSLTSDGNLSSDELPFLAYYDGPSKWTVLTLKRIVWRTVGSVHTISIDEVSQVTISAAAYAAMLSATKNPTPGNTPIDVKRRLNVIALVTTRGDISPVEFESGGPFFGFWNTINVMIRGSKEARPSNT
jgi:hypothetical protein